MIDEAMIETLVRTFYGRVRHDPLIGPVFEAKLGAKEEANEEKWEAHMQRLCAFWSSVTLMSGRYQGRPMAAHLPLPVDTAHFDRWLEIFAATAREVCPAPAAALFLERALRIADSLELGVAAHRGEIRSRRPRPAMELSSPACSMHEASDEYLGYAGKAELIGILNELLEAERAGARAALESETRWCGMLLRRIQALGGEPSRETGSSREQGWVATTLRETLPRVRDEALHADLSDMLRSQEANIERANEVR